MTNFKISSVRLNTDSPYSEEMGHATEALEFTAEDGRKVELHLTGDCCSHSYFANEALTDADGLVGQTLLSIEQVESKIENSNNSGDTDTGSVYNKYHAVKLSTDKETVTLDWRNESNGFYDGTCTVTGWCD